MRKLGLEDVFAFSEIVDKMGIEEDFNAIVDEAMKTDDPQSFAGQQIMISMVKNFHKAKDPIVKWVASIDQITEEEVMELSFVELKDTMMGIFQGEDVSAFFNSLVKKE